MGRRLKAVSGGLRPLGVGALRAIYPNAQASKSNQSSSRVEDASSVDLLRALFAGSVMTKAKKEQMERSPSYVHASREKVINEGC